MKSPNPPPPGTLDELLSADIDGELERAAADHGLTLDAARTAIATPEAVVRRAALTQARDLVASPVPLDPADADRLVAGALDRTRHENELAAARRRRNRFDAARRVAIAAAAIVVVFGGIAVLARGTTSSSSSGSKASSAGSARPEIAAPASPAAELGDLSTNRALRAKVLPRLPKHATDLPAHPSASASPPIEFNSNANGASAVDASRLSRQQIALLSLVGPKGPRGLVVGKSRATERAASTVRPSRVDCVEELAQSGRVPPAPVFSGSGTDGGRPVYVAAFRSGSGFAVYVLRATDCAVLRRTVV
jgi:hypothetical protein